MEHIYAKNRLSLGKLWKFQQKGIVCDATLLSDKIAVPVHRSVLCLASPYFYSMFANATLESTAKEIDVSHTIPSRLLWNVVELMYTSKCDCPSDLIFDFIICIDMLGIEITIPPDWQLLKWFEIYLGLTEYSSLSELLKTMYQTACAQIDVFSTTILNSDRFLTLSQDQMLQYINRETLYLPNRNIRNDSLQRWLDYDTTRVKKIELQPVPLNDIQLQWKSIENGFQIAVFNQKLAFHQMNHFPMVQNRYRHTIASFNGHVYAFGGISTESNEALDTIERFDYFSWTRLPTSLTSPRYGSTAAGQ